VNIYDVSERNQNEVEIQKGPRKIGTFSERKDLPEFYDLSNLPYLFEEKYGIRELK
jgi:hypothetical protein